MSVRKTLDIGSDYKQQAKFTLTVNRLPDRRVLTTIYAFSTSVAGKVSLYVQEDVDHPDGRIISKEVFLDFLQSFTVEKLASSW